MTSKKHLPISPAATVLREGWNTYDSTGWAVLCRRTVCPTENTPVPNRFFLSLGQIKGDLVLRKRSTGDRIRLPGRASKTVKKLLIDEKVPRLYREQLPVLADDAGVLAVALFGADAARLAQPGEDAVEIIFQKE